MPKYFFFFATEQMEFFQMFLHAIKKAITSLLQNPKEKNKLTEEIVNRIENVRHRERKNKKSQIKNRSSI